MAFAGSQMGTSEALKEEQKMGRPSHVQLGCLYKAQQDDVARRPQGPGTRRLRRLRIESKCAGEAFESVFYCLSTGIYLARTGTAGLCCATSVQSFAS
jgi:hypothetical protein